MSANEHLAAFIAAAIALATILTVGTLIAADIIQVGRRRAAVPDPAENGEPPEADQGLVAAWEPMGRSLEAGTKLGE